MGFADDWSSSSSASSRKGGSKKDEEVVLEQSDADQLMAAVRVIVVLVVVWIICNFALSFKNFHLSILFTCSSAVSLCRVVGLSHVVCVFFAFFLPIDLPL